MRINPDSPTNQLYNFGQITSLNLIFSYANLIQCPSYTRIRRIIMYFVQCLPTTQLSCGCGGHSLNVFFLVINITLIIIIIIIKSSVFHYERLTITCSSRLEPKTQILRNSLLRTITHFLIPWKT